ncbi:hypothetical protein Malapachy_0695 [Malassezia pachydermatis]|uniref:Ribosomal protein/NADH dehydrogenase domain-containing protein n=1 Tax=Malassezia pachydermatis TaxID=77020 RepID=A0A0M9VQ27_9BASI|nr:hypothetical protein Malapachy_0695 [Malassezia pachydermatis]KOS15085.1 hypothetical protein Malapachy_0695 [Malassezia pachydermatis]
MPSARELATVLEFLQTGAASRRLPGVKSLQFRVPKKFSDRRDWTLMRRELPRLVYANPALQVDVEHPNDEPPSMQVQFSNMPARTIVFGEKNASDIVRELMTMAQFTEKPASS